MLTKILENNEQALLFEELVTAFLTVEDLRTWLQTYYTAGLPRLGGGNLEHELSSLITWAKAQDGMETLLQQLADHPPHGDVDLPAIIFALTLGEIKAQAKTSNGLPVVPQHQSWLAADRPSVNRKDLRKHLEDLATSPPGARCILVIEGKERSGKSFAVSLARGCQAPANLLPTMDMKKFAIYGKQLNSCELAVLIVAIQIGPAKGRWTLSNTSRCAVFAELARQGKLTEAVRANADKPDNPTQREIAIRLGSPSIISSNRPLSSISRW